MITYLMPVSTIIDCHGSNDMYEEVDSYAFLISVGSVGVGTGMSLFLSFYAAMRVLLLPLDRYLVSLSLCQCQFYQRCMILYERLSVHQLSVSQHQSRG